MTLTDHMIAQIHPPIPNVSKLAKTIVKLIQANSLAFLTMHPATRGVKGPVRQIDRRKRILAWCADTLFLHRFMVLVCW